MTPALAASHPSPAVIAQADGLTARYPGRSQRGVRAEPRTVLAGLDLAIRPAEIVGLLGANGAGKTTLLRCLLGLRQPDAGSSALFGCPSAALGAAEKARLGVVPQLASLHPWMRVGDQVDYVAAFYARWDEALVGDLLRRWQLSRRARISVLSPGEQQRLALVLALGHRPELLILDEPAASLDPLARREALSALLERAASDGATVVLSTHLTGDVERIASRVVVLRGGRILLDRDVEEVRERIVRLRLTSDRPLPALELPGTLATHLRPDGATYTIDGDPAAALARCAAMPGVTAVMEPLSLEELFVDLHTCA